MKQFAQQFVTNRMQRFRISILIVLCFIALGLWTSTEEQTFSPEAPRTLAGVTAAVDPGHGGYDGGARAVESGRWEKELTLQISQAVRKELEARGAKVVLTRTQDVCLSEDGSGKARKRADLQRRLDIAQEAGADVFLSIHLNEYRDRAQSGPQVFYQQGADAGRLLAGAVQESLIRTLQPAKERKANAGDYYVLRNTALPAVLVECGFLSNAEEEKKLLSRDYQKRIAQAVADGLEEWRKLSENGG